MQTSYMGREKSVSVRLSDIEDNCLKKLSRHYGCSKSEVVRLLIRYKFDDLESLQNKN